MAIGVATTAAAPTEPSRSSPSSTRTGCPPLILYYSRGSGQALDQTERRGDIWGLAEPGRALFKALSEAYGSEAVGTFANAYPAVNVSPRVRRVYLPSAELGVRNVQRNVRDLLATCPGSRLVLGGYSQGAQVIHAALARLSESEAERIAAVVLFGDPYFNAQDTEVAAQRSTSAGLAFNPLRVGVAFYRALRFPKLGNLPATLAGKVFSWCHDFDPVCQGVEFFHPLRELKNKAKSHLDYDLDAEAATSRVVVSLKQVGVYPKTDLNDQYRIANTCAGATCGVAIWTEPSRADAHTLGALGVVPE